MLLARHAGEMGVHLDALAVADHQQRRVLQRQRVHHQLLQRAFEAAARRLVFPGEVALQPHVGKAVGAAAGAAGLAEATLEAVGLRVAWFGHAKHAAQVDEMRLCPARSFSSNAGLPGAICV